MATERLRSVPAHHAEIACGADSGALAGYGLMVGNAVEVDLARLERDLPELAERVARYAERVATFEHGPYIAVSFPILSIRQQDNAAGRSDLTEQLEALYETEVAELVDLLLASEVDHGRLATLGAAWNLTIASEPGDRSVATFQTRGRRAWPAALGGAAGAREVARQWRMEISHARWRDRRVRRLLALDVRSVEILPDPDAADSEPLGSGTA